MEQIQEILAKVTQELAHLSENAKKLIIQTSTHKATPSMVKDIIADDHGISTPIGQIASISTPNTTTLHIDPWDQKLLPNIQEAINKTRNSDLNPQIVEIEKSGHNTEPQRKIIKINLPPLTGQRRDLLTKKVKVAKENTKVKMRQEREEHRRKISELKSQSISKDDIEKGKKNLDLVLEKYIKKIEKTVEEVIEKVSKL